MYSKIDELIGAMKANKIDQFELGNCKLFVGTNSLRPYQLRLV
jgi:hypothetical protein